MMLLILLFSACFASSIHGEKLHEHMTKEEIKSVFKVDHDFVHTLDYEVVPVFHQREDILRSSNPTIHLRAFDKDYTLYLEENKNVLVGSNTPVYIAKAETGKQSGGEPKIVYSRVPYPLPEKFKLYHDVENRAAVTIHPDGDDKVHVNGIVDDKLIVRALPSRVHREVLNERSSFFNNFPKLNFPFFDGDKFGTNFTHHVVINPLNLQEKYSSYVKHIGDKLNKLHSKIANPLKLPGFFGGIKNRPIQNPGIWQRPHDMPTIKLPTTTRKPFPWQSVTQEPHIPRPTAAPEEPSDNTLYPEMLVVVDYDSYVYHGSDINEIATYMAAFWNAVDLRFREFDNPKIRLNIAGLIIPKDRVATAYIHRHPYGREGTLESDSTLYSVRNYFSQDKSFPKDKYDMVIAVSNELMGSFQKNEFVVNVEGIAFVGRICQTEIGLSTGIVIDKGGFDGIVIAAHEIGHILGASHDFDENKCKQFEEGHLMDYTRRDSRGVHWSQCSKEAMKTVLRSEQAQCLKNKPNLGTPYKKILPGRIFSRDEQCKKYMGLVSYKRFEHDCAQLWCFHAVFGQALAKDKPPAEGSYCGKGKICLDAECVDDPELD